jgi:helix-turn-helix protein
MNEPRLAVDVRCAAEMLSISPRQVQNYLRLKILRGRKLGRRTVIPVSELSRLLRSDQPCASLKGERLDATNNTQAEQATV